MLVRSPHNPLIKPADLKPSRTGFEVIGVFNAGAAIFNDQVILLVRVAERPVSHDSDVILCPYLRPDGELAIKEIRRDDPDYDSGDPRKVYNRHTGELFLTSMSHLRLAHSKDGVHLMVGDHPWLVGTPPYETFGVEDARITRIDNVYYVNYTAVSEAGVATAMVSTQDFVRVERHGIVFPPANRDVVIFPERINGLYACYHRPMPGMFGRMDIWMATSPDLIHWGQHRRLWDAKRDGWESGRVGGGAPPIFTKYGWLCIYHAADRADRYCLGAFLTAHNDPGHILAYSQQPVLSPQLPYETEGFFKNVVFSCGATLNGEVLRVYYGAADETLALAQIPLDDLVKSLSRN